MIVFFDRDAPAAVTGSVRRQVGLRASLEQTVVSGNFPRRRGSRRCPDRRRSGCERQTKNTRCLENTRRTKIRFSAHSHRFDQETTITRL
jgi:hypothetical protein